VKRLFLVLLLVLCLVMAACTGAAVRTLNQLQQLQGELTKKFGDQVYVNVNETRGELALTVSFINSALNEKTDGERFKRAAEAAKVVRANYADVNKLRVIWIGFLRMRSRMIVFHHTEALSYYPFDPEARSLREPDVVTPETPLETTANYHPTRNQSDVFAYGIQLEGQPGKDGVTLVPNFKTTGDVNVKKGPPPKTVQFDFASYSSKPRFQQTAPITFLADDKPVLETEGTFFGNEPQFCYLPVPYTAFRKMLAAKQLTIKLGAKEYRLTPRQMAVLQEMTRYVTQ
jgi:hypothetical protein